MGKESLLRLVQKIVEEKYEGDDIELKSGHEGNPKAFYDTLSSFSNTRGGTIIFGIDEKKNYELCGVKDFVGVRKTIEEVCKQMVPPVRAIISEAQDAEGRHFVAAEIPELPYTEKPCYYYPLGVSKGSFVRNGEADEPMSEFEIYEYELEKHQKSSETQTLPNLTDDNIDQNQLNVFLSLATRNKPNLMNLDRNTVLTMLGMRKDGKPTLACLLCFGKYPQEFAPLLNINCVRINGEEYVSEDTTFNRFAANATIGDNLQQMLDAALSQVILGTDGKRMNGDEYPLLACRELLLNCLVHRDYSDRSATIPISVTFYSNRLEFKNPGGLFAGTKIEDLGRNYCPVRNPFLCSCINPGIIINRSGYCSNSYITDFGNILNRNISHFFSLVFIKSFPTFFILSQNTLKTYFFLCRGSTQINFVHNVSYKSRFFSPILVSIALLSVSTSNFHLMWMAY